MRIKYLRLAAAVLLLASNGNISHAASTAELRASMEKTCLENVADPSTVIRACTFMIKKRGASNAQLSAYYVIRSGNLRESDKYTEALQDAEKAIQLDQSATEPQFARASVLYYRNQYDDARKLFEKMMERMENFSTEDRARLFKSYADVIDDMGESDKAIEYYNKAVALFEDSNTFQNRSFSFSKIGKYDLALDDCRKAIELDKNASFAYKQCGIAYLGKGDLSKSEEQFQEALRILPINWRAHLGLAAVHRKKGDFEAAIKEFEIALQSPRDKDVAQKGIDEVRALIALRDKPAVVDPKSANAAIPVEIEVKAPPTDKPAATAPSLPNVRRVALIIGNSSYTAVPQLANPSRDANAMAATLKSIGFTSVTTALDASRADTIKALRKFEEDSTGADWGLIYYAGHGIEFSGENYLIPVEAELKTDKDVDDEAVQLKRVMTAFSGVKTLGLVVLDACRNNPFKNKMKRTIATRAVDNGLARVEPPRGSVLVAYAAKDGEVALDGSGANSPYVTALMKRIKEPNLEIRKLLGLVRDDVLTATSDQQEPFTYGALGGKDYVLNPN